MTITIITEENQVFARQSSYMYHSHCPVPSAKTLFLQKVVELMKEEILVWECLHDELKVTYTGGVSKPYSRNSTPPSAATTGVYLQKCL